MDANDTQTLAVSEDDSGQNHPREPTVTEKPSEGDRTATNRPGSAIEFDTAAFVAEILDASGNAAVLEARAPDATATTP